MRPLEQTLAMVVAVVIVGLLCVGGVEILAWVAGWQR